MVQRAGQNLQLLIEKVEILFGNRGNPRDYALRRGELVDVQKIISDVKSSLEGLRKSLQQVKGDIDQINLNVAEVEGRVSTAEQAINDAEEAINALDRVLGELNQRIQGAESALTQLESEIGRVNSEVGVIGGDLQSVQQDISHIQNDVAQLVASIQSIEGSITEIESDINVMSNQIADINTELASVFALHSNPGATPFPAGVLTAIPFYTPGESTRVVLTTNKTFTVSKAGLYQFELEVRINGGGANMPPVGTPVGLSIDTTTVPAGLKAGYSGADDVSTRTILRLVCVERLVAGAQRVAYFFNGGTASYQIASAVIKVVRISA